MRFFFDRRKAYRYVLQHPWCCSVKRLQGGVLFLKLGNILCSPAPSRALEIFDAASTISLPAPARPHRHPDGHTCTYWWSHGVQSHVLTEPDTRVSVQQRAAVRALSESALRASVGRTAYE
jgi:hypothetical protein